ncbi:MAG: bifunctional adenosylcobinamide kinase/adenosylcobinamide-phosphate guanylyltransferase [Clostridiales bacterium]|nr:bifunctional adenosylcobinamide kinase/adenosylcobinamide-phosphate guanylyltransferase [Clostridiales bacterium]
MLYVVTGVSGSGKSEYAENLAVRLAAGAPLYYVATMEPYGAEGQARIRRHHRLRAGKGFETIECYREITRVVDQIGQCRCGESVLLVECLSNLLANEMFGARTQKDAPADKVLSGTSFLSRQCRHLIVVTNEIFADGIRYAPETEEYRKQLGLLNRRLAGMADEAVEVAYGIPVRIGRQE